MYKTANEYYKEKYGCKVYKLSLDAGFTCPNRDGTKGLRGCIFCTGSAEFAESCKDGVIPALERAKKRVDNKTKDGKYIAYFQSFTNTYGTVENLSRLFFDVVKPDYIVGLNIATRPDCLPNQTVRLLSEINKIKPVTVELGLQTVNEKTAEYIRRGYPNEVYSDAVSRLKENGIEVITHIMIGLPFETEEDAVKTVKFAVENKTDGVKFHLLHILKNTDLEREYKNGKFSCLTLVEYGNILKSCIEVLPDNIAVHRITGDGDKKTLVAPLWSADKKKVLNYLKEILKDT